VDKFDAGFNISESLYNEFIREAGKKGVKRQGKDLSKSDRYIKTMLKAYIGRNLLDNDGFYPILNTIDPGFLKAVEMLKK
jgi:carboxyl-terminal processing protease